MQTSTFLFAALSKASAPTNEWDVLLQHGLAILICLFALVLVVGILAYLFLRTGRVIVSSESNHGQGSRVRHEIVIETPPGTLSCAENPNTAVRSAKGNLVAEDGRSARKRRVKRKPKGR
jgi:hypothetical protein